LAQARDFVLIKSCEIFELVCKKLRSEEIDIDKILEQLYNAKGEFEIAI